MNLLSAEPLGRLPDPLTTTDLLLMPESPVTWWLVTPYHYG